MQCFSARLCALCVSAVGLFWQNYETARFHDYAILNTRPGRDVRDLAVGGGKLLNLYTLQGPIPETRTGAYHGYAARAGELIEAVRNTDPKLVSRLQALMASHFATDALLWYWGPESLRIRSGKVLGGRPVDSMPMAEQRPLPSWMLAIDNSRLLLSNTGAAFLIDAGSARLPAKLTELIASGRVKTVEGIWITHYHDDHTDVAQALADRFRCPIYFTARMKDVLERPGDFHLPCLTPNAITSGKPQPDGARMTWHEFRFTFYFFPGQTLYHGGMLIERGNERLFMTGDSFTPSGIDDYCLYNRNFVGEAEPGYSYCLNLLQRLPEDTWLINQHVEPMFHFSAAHYTRMREELAKRATILTELSPWPDPNYLVDANWAAIEPYGSKVREDQTISLGLRILNHSPRTETYGVKWNIPSGWEISRADAQLTIPPRQEKAARATITARTTGLHVITTDIHFAGRDLKEQAEALVRVARGD